MNDSIAIKLAAGLATAGATAGATLTAAVDSIEHTERLMLGVPQSVLLFSLAGTLIGVLLLRDADTDRITPDANVTSRSARLRQLMVRVASLGLILGCYAVVNAWIVVLAAAWFPSLAGAPQPILAGISGVLIRRMLPRYLGVVERATSALGGKQ